MMLSASENDPSTVILMPCGKAELGTTSSTSVHSLLVISARQFKTAVGQVLRTINLKQSIWCKTRVNTLLKTKKLVYNFHLFIWVNYLQLLDDRSKDYRCRLIFISWLGWLSVTKQDLSPRVQHLFQPLPVEVWEQMLADCDIQYVFKTCWGVKFHKVKKCCILISRYRSSVLL